MKRNKAGLFSRRWLLGGAGATALGLPFMGPRARAGVSGGAKRLIVFCSPNEPIDRAHWMPSGGNGNSFAMTALHPIMAALEPFREKLLLIGDTELTSALADDGAESHGSMTHLLVGRHSIPYGPDGSEQWAGGISVDQYIAAARGVDALTLGVRVPDKDGNARISFLGPSQPVDPIETPDLAFDSLFADATLPADELAALKARRLSVLDRVAGDLSRVSATLPTEARHKLDIHADMIRDLETKIQNDKLLQCEPTAPAPADYEDNEMFPTTVRRQIDVMVQALGCGVTDVASLQLSDSQAGNLTPLWPDEGLDINVDYHNISHDYSDDPTGEVLERRVQTEAFMYSMFGYLLQKLEDVPDVGGGSMLDNTVVLWMKALGWSHEEDQMLFMLAGGASGGLQTGRYVGFPGAPHNNLLVNICNLMGLDDTTYGDPLYCTGPLDL